MVWMNEVSFYVNNLQVKSPFQNDGRIARHRRKFKVRREIGGFPVRSGLQTFCVVAILLDATEDRFDEEQI